MKLLELFESIDAEIERIENLDSLPIGKDFVKAKDLPSRLAK